MRPAVFLLKKTLLPLQMPVTTGKSIKLSGP